jgi:dTDP-4-amino-4,6-dideoxygalactose transaminase
MIPVTKSYLPPIDDYIGHMERIWRTGWLTNNSLLAKELADNLCVYLDVPQIELVANGTLALQIAIRALGLKGEIIATPFSYVATMSAMLWEGCDPVFVDIEDKTFCIDTNLIEAAITERTSAILATHVYGYPCNVAEIERIAGKYNLKVIYDAAHAFGVKLKGQSVVNCGDISALSFHATKLFHTAEGGAIICRDPEIARRVNLMKRFGHIGEDAYSEIGINAKMSELHAAMGLAVLPKVSIIIDYRKKCSGQYTELLASLSLRIPDIPPETEYNYAYYPVVFDSSDTMMRVRKELLDSGIGPRRYFYPSLNTLPYLRPELQCRCRVSEDIANKVLCLPLYFGLERHEIEGVCKIIGRAVK